MDTMSAIQNAITNKEKITVSYLGGSHPGSMRTIAPISIKNGKIRARCYASGKVKVFIADKIKLDPNQEIVPAWSSSPKYTTLNDLHFQIRQDLEYLGWHVVHEKQEDSEIISLHRKFKDGHPLKSVEAEISWNKYEQHSILISDPFDFENPVYRHETRYSLRPYCVTGKNNTSKTFKHLDKAAAYFIDLSKQLDPASKRKSKK